MMILSADIGLPNAREAATDFAVAVDGGRIVMTGSRAEVMRAHPDAQREHFAGCALLPGLVNSHDHGRGLGTAALGVEDAPLEAWLWGLWSQPEIPPHLAALYDGLRLARSGVTATAHSHNPRAWAAQGAEGRETVRGYREAGIRVALHPVVVDQNRLIYATSPEEERAFIASLPMELQADARGMIEAPLTHDEYFEQCEALFREAHDADGCTAHIQVSPAGGQWCSDALIARAVAWARSRGTRVQMHMLETHRQRDYALRKWGMSFVRHLDEIGAIGPWLTLAHMVWVERDDLALLADRGVSIAHNPSSNLRLRSGVAPLSAMLAAGVNVGVGLDGHALDDDQDYLRELRLAWSLANMRANQPESEAAPVSAPAVLHAGTAGGAAATFGASAPLGQLVTGALADLVVLDLSFAALDPLARPAALAADMLHLATRADVRHVMCNGEWVVRDSASTGVDEAAVLREIRAIVRRQARPDPAAARRAALVERILGGWAYRAP